MAKTVRTTYVRKVDRRGGVEETETVQTSTTLGKVVKTAAGVAVAIAVLGALGTSGKK